ncbi:MAG: hypothetical protein ACLFV7_10470 [Phycisphaerae bacterium]
MPETEENPDSLPSKDELQQAIDVYLRVAYGDAPLPATAERYLPPDHWDPQGYLLSDAVERTPPESPPQQVRSYAIRLGNPMYPNMKLRLARPPRENVFLLSVDCHDQMLQAPPDSPDFAALEQLKQFNADLATQIVAAWEDAGLTTEKSHLRDTLRRARARRDSDASDAS